MNAPLEVQAHLLASVRGKLIDAADEMNDSDVLRELRLAIDHVERAEGWVAVLRARADKQDSDN